MTSTETPEPSRHTPQGIAPGASPFQFGAGGMAGLPDMGNVAGGMAGGTGNFADMQREVSRAER